MGYRATPSGDRARRRPRLRPRVRPDRASRWDRIPLVLGPRDARVPGALRRGRRGQREGRGPAPGLPRVPCDPGGVRPGRRQPGDRAGTPGPGRPRHPRSALCRTVSRRIRRRCSRRRRAAPAPARDRTVPGRRDGVGRRGATGAEPRLGSRHRSAPRTGVRRGDPPARRPGGGGRTGRRGARDAACLPAAARRSGPSARRPGTPAAGRFGRRPRGCGRGGRDTPARCPRRHTGGTARQQRQCGHRSGRGPARLRSPGRNDRRRRGGRGHRARAGPPGHRGLLSGGRRRRRVPRTSQLSGHGPRSRSGRACRPAAR